VAKPAPPKQATGASKYIEEHQLSNGRVKIKPADVTSSFDEMAKGDSQSAKNFRQMMQFQEKNNITTIWATGREKGPFDFNYWSKSPKYKSSLKSGLSRSVDTLPDYYGRERDMHVISHKQMSKMLNDIDEGNLTSRIMSMGKLKGGTAGHTADGFGAIVVKQGTHQVAMTADRVEKIRAAVRTSVDRSFGGYPKPLAGSDLWKRTGKSTWKAPEDWMVTYVHEMGHQVHYLAGQPRITDYLPKDLLKRTTQKNLDGVKALQEVKDKTWKPSQYGVTNEYERFAETYVQYVYSPEELKQANPAAYKWVEDAIKKGLK
jgi:hypothetical protein